MKRLVRYIKGTMDMVLDLIPDNLPFHVDTYTDSDWADDKDDRKSVSCGMIYLCGCMIKSWARTQKVLALSSTEAELYALGSGASELLGMKEWLKELQIPLQSTMLHCDSNPARSIVNKRGPGKIKHMELRYLALQMWVKEGRLGITRVPTTDNPSDLGTKALSSERMKYLCGLCGLRNLSDVT
jgi:hypothetical protein